MTTRQNLNVRQGTTWTFTHTVLSGGAAVDLTNYTGARMAVKTGYGAGNAAYLSTGSDANGGTLTLGGVAGTVVMAMTSAQTADLSGYMGLTVRPKSQLELFIYDLELIDGSGDVSRELEGRFVLHREVTT